MKFNALYEFNKIADVEKEYEEIARTALKCRKLDDDGIQNFFQKLINCAGTEMRLEPFSYYSDDMIDYASTYPAEKEVRLNANFLVKNNEQKLFFDFIGTIYHELTHLKDIDFQRNYKFRLFGDKTSIPYNSDFLMQSCLTLQNKADELGFGDDFYNYSFLLYYFSRHEMIARKKAVESCEKLFVRMKSIYKSDEKYQTNACKEALKSFVRVIKHDKQIEIDNCDEFQSLISDGVAEKTKEMLYNFVCEICNGKSIEQTFNKDDLLWDMVYFSNALGAREHYNQKTVNMFYDYLNKNITDNNYDYFVPAMYALSNLTLNKNAKKHLEGVFEVSSNSYERYDALQNFIDEAKINFPRIDEKYLEILNRKYKKIVYINYLKNKPNQLNNQYYLSLPKEKNIAKYKTNSNFLKNCRKNNYCEKFIQK